MAVQASAEVILLPKQLRMEWMDAIALDARVSHTAFRVAGVVGRHFSRHRAETFIKQETIARILLISPRTVWSAVMELESCGYLVIERKELGVTSNGRRICGGRGTANVYRPAFERSQLVATTSGKKLAERCDQIWEERSQNRAPKVATNFDPTLSLPSEDNPTGISILARIRAIVGEDAWLRRWQYATFESPRTVIFRHERLFNELKDDKVLARLGLTTTYRKEAS